MYTGAVTFHINKSFATVQVVPQSEGLRLVYTPIENGKEVIDDPGYIDVLVPLDAVGGIWATARAFLYAVESLDENIILQSSSDTPGDNDILIKLYRDKPQGDQGTLTGKEACWLRIVNGRTEAERRRIKMGPRDLLCLELGCQTTMTISGAAAHS